MPLYIDHFITLRGEVLPGFWIRNSTGKKIAVGTGRELCRVLAKRYFNDYDLCRKLARLTGVDPTYRDKRTPLTQCCCGGYVVIEKA